MPTTEKIAQWEWTVAPEDDQGAMPCHSLIAGAGGVLCRWWGTDEPPAARLIEAAPDMLAALKFCRSVMVANGIVELSEQMAIEKIDAAIAKAGA